jgi:hypothetical protein
LVLESKKKKNRCPFIWNTSKKRRFQFCTEVDDEWDESKVDDSLDDLSDLEDGFLGFVFHDVYVPRRRRRRGECKKCEVSESSSPEGRPTWY